MPSPTQHTVLQLDTSIELGPVLLVWVFLVETSFSICHDNTYSADDSAMIKTLKPGSCGNKATSKLTADLFLTVALCVRACVCVSE